MQRRQLFEFTDLPSCPPFIRRLLVDYLRTVLRLFQLDQAMIPLLSQVLLRSGARSIVDLCSGAAGPLPALLSGLRAQGVDAAAVLTDRYPHPLVWQEVCARAQQDGLRLDFVATSVDATQVDPALRGVRTLFDCLHHFPPEQARALLRDAARQGAPLLACEVTERSPKSVLLCLLVPLLLLVITPLIRPLTWWRLLFTYLIPLALVTITWDAVVSALRSYTPDELLQLARDPAVPDYTWEAGRVLHLGMPITYLIGIPAPARPPAGAVGTAG